MMNFCTEKTKKMHQIRDLLFDENINPFFKNLEYFHVSKTEIKKSSFP